jgi:hypothetical protein
MMHGYVFNEWDHSLSLKNSRAKQKQQPASAACTQIIRNSSLPGDELSFSLESNSIFHLLLTILPGVNTFHINQSINCQSNAIKVGQVTKK